MVSAIRRATDSKSIKYFMLNGDLELLFSLLTNMEILDLIKTKGRQWRAERTDEEIEIVVWLCLLGSPDGISKLLCAF